jgi:hypothetical protein
MRRLPIVLLIAMAALASCGGNTTPSGTVSVNFVGNSTCDTTGQTPYSPLPPNTNSAPVGQPIDEMPHVHVAEGATVNYMHNPPTSGCHYSLGTGTAPIGAGVYPPTALPKLTAEYWVHNLEHGYIVVSYNCSDGCAADIASLNTFYRSLPPDPGGAVPYAKFIAVPYPAQKERFDVESWDWFDPIGSTLNLTEVKKFYDNHVNQSPEGASTG